MCVNKEQNILLVDDSKIIRQKTRELIESFGHKVNTADGGKDGVSKILRDKPDLVLLDIEMPDMDGLEVFREIRQRDKFQVLPIIIFFTSCSEKRLEGIQLGASDFISKTLPEKDPVEFKSRIHAHLKIADLIKEKIKLEKLHFIKAASTSVHHEIFQPLTVINVGVSSVLSRHDLISRCDHCVSALTPAKKAVGKITKTIKEFGDLKETETVEISGGGTVLNRSRYNDGDEPVFTNKLKVLVVDDDPSITRTLSRHLEFNDHQFEVAEDGLAALKILTKKKGGFDLVIADLNLPYVNGIEIRKSVEKKWPSVKTVVWSGHPRDEAQNIWSKTEDWETLKKTLENFPRK